jgi:hypothetical protein
LVRKMLNRDRGKRLTAHEALCEYMEAWKPLYIETSISHPASFSRKPLL